MGVIAWLQENCASYCDSKSLTEETVTTEKKIDKFCRYWVYSHHIYSKVKRKNILDLASEFCLTGFCQPGKPGWGIANFSQWENRIDVEWPITGRETVNSLILFVRNHLHWGISKELSGRADHDKMSVLHCIWGRLGYWLNIWLIDCQVYVTTI